MHDPIMALTWPVRIVQMTEVDYGDFASAVGAHPAVSETWPQISPRRTATAAASARALTPSLAKRLARWVCTVREPMKSAEAISRSVRPLATRRSTSVSQGVSGPALSFECCPCAAPAGRSGGVTVPASAIISSRASARPAAQAALNPAAPSAVSTADRGSSCAVCVDRADGERPASARSPSAAPIRRAATSGWPLDTASTASLPSTLAIPRGRRPL